MTIRELLLNDSVFTLQDVILETLGPDNDHVFLFRGSWYSDHFLQYLDYRILTFYHNFSSGCDMIFAVPDLCFPKRYFVETNGYNMLVFVYAGNQAICFDCETLEDAKKFDYSGIEGEKDIAVAAAYCSKQDHIFTFNINDSGYENVIEL